MYRIEYTQISKKKKPIIKSNRNRSSGSTYRQRNTTGPTNFRVAIHSLNIPTISISCAIQLFCWLMCVYDSCYLLIHRYLIFNHFKTWSHRINVFGWVDFILLHIGFTYWVRVSVRPRLILFLSLYVTRQSVVFFVDVFFCVRRTKQRNYKLYATIVRRFFCQPHGMDDEHNLTLLSIHIKPSATSLIRDAYIFCRKSSIP